MFNVNLTTAKLGITARSGLGGSGVELPGPRQRIIRDGRGWAAPQLCSPASWSRDSAACLSPQPEVTVLWLSPTSRACLAAGKCPARICWDVCVWRNDKPGISVLLGGQGWD